MISLNEDTVSEHLRPIQDLLNSCDFTITNGDGEICSLVFFILFYSSRVVHAAVTKCCRPKRSPKLAECCYNGSVV